MKYATVMTQKTLRCNTKTAIKTELRPSPILSTYTEQAPQPG